MVGQLGTTKVAQIFAYGKCLWIYTMLLCGATDLDQRGLRTRRSTQGSACGWLEQCSHTFRGQTTNKWNLGAMNRTFKPKHKKWFKICITFKREKIFTGDSHHDGVVRLPNKSNMGDSGHLEFCNILISLYWMKIFAQNLVQRCNTTMQRCPTDQKRNQMLICMTSSVECLEHGSFSAIFVCWVLYQIWFNHHGGTCQIHLSLKIKMEAAAILNFVKCQYLRIGPPYLESCITRIEMIAGTLITLLITVRWFSAYMYSIALVMSTTFSIYIVLGVFYILTNHAVTLMWLSV